MKRIMPLAILLMFISLLFTQCLDVNDLNSVAITDNIVGTWHAVRDEGGIQTDYQVEIVKSATADSVITISNFFNNGESATATVHSNMTIELPEQTLGNITVSGQASISTDFQKITWSVIADGDLVTIEMTPGTVTKFAQQ